MASLHGFTDGSYDYKQSYIFNQTPEYPNLDPNTLLGFLVSEGNPFAEIVSRTDLKHKYANKQADFTLLVPSNLQEWLNVQDSYKLKQFVLYHTLERTIGARFFQSSPAMMINTRLPGSRIVAENFPNSNPVLNRESTIIGEHRVGNANIIFIDNALSLDINPMTNVDI